MINIPIENMHEVIGSHVRDGRHVSITRYGDGEAIVLNGFRDLEKLKYVMRRQFSYIPPVEEIEQIRENLVSAYSNTDIIGIPVKNRFMDDPQSYWFKAFGILNETIGVDVLQTKQLTSIDFHAHMLDNGLFDELLGGLDTLCYVSCRNLDDAFRRRYGIKKIFSYIIAPEAKFTPGYRGKKHYPDQFNEIKKWMTKIPVSGNLCLTGAGFTGKIYNNWFRDHGGIGVDIGCVFDFWYGKVTRGKERGAESYSDKFKL